MLPRYLLLNVDHITQPSPIANRKMLFAYIFITRRFKTIIGRFTSFSRLLLGLYAGSCCFDEISEDCADFSTRPVRQRA